MPAEHDRIPVGIYWDPQLWDEARAAFVSDLKHDPDPAPAFIVWLHRALEAHVARGPQGRAKIGIKRPEARAPGEGQGKSRMSPLDPGTLDRVDDAVAADFEELNRLGGRSGFVHEAVTAAVDAARARRPDQTLPPAPKRLSNNPHRRRPLRRPVRGGRQVVTGPTARVVDNLDRVSAGSGMIEPGPREDTTA